MTEPQQSALFAKYMELLHWHVARIDNVYVYFRRFSVFGGIIKIHRPARLPSTEQLIPIIKEYKLTTLVIEPTEKQDQKELNIWCRRMVKHIRINSSPYLPTKTTRIDITRDEDTIFKSFSEAKRRAVRRATKLGVTVNASDDIGKLIGIKNKSAGFLGFITTTGIREMWPLFAPKHASIVLAYDKNQKIVGGVLLLHWEDISYYWIAGATKYGKKLFAPTLLVWEAIKESKKFKSKWFDFVGVWDERLPQEHTEWKGFTKFKEGFDGTLVYYPLIYRIVK